MLLSMRQVGDSTSNGVHFSQESCGEGADRSSLDLFGQQMELLQALVKANSTAKLVVVLIHGRPATFGGPAQPPSAAAGGGKGALFPGEAADEYYVGCFADGNGNGQPGARLLPANGPGADNNISSWTGFEGCLRFCHEQGFVFAGVEDGHECYCGNRAPPSSRKENLTNTHCTKPCAPSTASGWASPPGYTCGGGWFLDLYVAPFF